MTQQETQSQEWSTDDEGDDIGERKNKFETRRNAFIYLLDSRKKMFSADCSIENEIPFLQCLKCIRNSSRAKIWASDKALCAFVLLGTNKADNLLHLNNIAVVEPLRNLSSDFIMKLDELAKKVEDSSFEKDFGWDSFSLADALWLCFKMFHDSAKTMKLNKTIILFTNDDNPSKDDRNEFNRIISCARDMVESKIMFDLIHLGENFNVNHLFKELIQLSRGDMDYEIPDPVTKMKEMVNRSLKIDYRHVTLATIPFEILDGFKFDVSVHYLVRKVKLPFKVKLSKATNEVVTTKTQFFETETGQRIPKENLVKSYNFGGKEIAFTMSELEHIESFSDKGLRLIGFKPASVVNLEHFVQPCAFIYPNNPEDIEGSSFFVALQQKCLEKQVVPICTFCPRSRSSLRYVALIAQEEETAPDNTQLCPDGFLVFFLPFAEEVRDLDSKCTGKSRASQEQVSLAKKLIKKLKFNYKADLFKNPRLAAHWSAVEALALNLKEPDSFHDSTVPNYTAMRDRTEAIADEFRNLIYTDGYDPEGNAPRKRTKPLKAAKAAEQGLEVDAAAVEKFIRSGEVNRLTNDMLKSYLHQVGEGKGTSKMKKSDLLEKACRYLKVPVPLGDKAEEIARMLRVELELLTRSHFFGSSDPCRFETFARPMSYKCFRGDMYGMNYEEIEGTPKHRHQANARERVRTCSVNTAFAMLRTLIPTEPADRKLSKIETLRLACGYIAHLGALLVSGSCESAFQENKEYSQRPQVCTFCVALIKKNDSRRFSPS